MASLMEPLRAEHRELAPSIERLREAGDRVGVLPFDGVDTEVDASIEFLVGHLLPHANAEEAVLYPAVARAMGGPMATATMSRDHVAVDRLTHELVELRARLADDGLTTEIARELRRVLYGLYTLVKVHFAKEEEIYVPLLEAALSADEAADLFAAMHRAAHAH